MRITINLATRPFTDLGPIFKRLRIAMIVFAVVSIGLGIGLHALHSKAEAARARERGLDNQIGRINAERQGYMAMMRQPDNAQVLDQAGNLNQLFDQKTFSWTLAMEDLETVLPGGVQVTTLEPIRDKEGRITLRLRVVGPRDKAVELVQNLEHSHHFLRPSIVGESTENTGGPGVALEPVSATNKVNFDLLADYNPATIGEKPTVLKSAPSENSTENSPASSPAPNAMHPAAAGPGLRRPPYSGVSRPQATPQAGTHSQPGGSPSPAATTPSGVQRNSAVPNPQAAPKPHAGVPQ
ncbi:MAG TPA: fimbrial assembly protein [Terracidiphilus sp.]|nr:fimbrial assembly protein [Terracidiphilus sp.]